MRSTVSVRSCSSRFEFSSRLVSRRRLNFRSSDKASFPRSVLIHGTPEIVLSRKLTQGSGCCQAIKGWTSIESLRLASTDILAVAQTVLTGRVDFQQIRRAAKNRNRKLLK